MQAKGKVPKDIVKKILDILKNDPNTVDLYNKATKTDDLDDIPF